MACLPISPAGRGLVIRLGLEPWTNRWRPDPQQGIDAGEWLRLEAGEVVNTQLEASAFEGAFV